MSSSLVASIIQLRPLRHCHYKSEAVRHGLSIFKGYLMSTNTASASNVTVRKAPLIVTGCLTAAVIPLSIAGPAVVVPSIHQALGGSAVELTWIINAYISFLGHPTVPIAIMKPMARPLAGELP